MSAQFFGRSGKVLYGAFSIVGMASQLHNVNKGIPDDRVARSTGGQHGFIWISWPSPKLGLRPYMAICKFMQDGEAVPSGKLAPLVPQLTGHLTIS